jgi:hypothetical protein
VGIRAGVFGIWDAEVWQAGTEKINTQKLNSSIRFSMHETPIT